MSMERLTWEYSNGGYYMDSDDIKHADFDGADLCYGEAVNRLALLEDTLEKHNITAEQLDEVLMEREWISVKDRLPQEKSCNYLVLTKMNWGYGGTWDSNNGDSRQNMIVSYCDCTGQFNVPYVTHWMPLPKPPKEAAEATLTAHNNKDLCTDGDGL